MGFFRKGLLQRKEGRTIWHEEASSPSERPFSGPRGFHKAREIHGVIGAAVEPRLQCRSGMGTPRGPDMLLARIVAKHKIFAPLLIFSAGTRPFPARYQMHPPLATQSPAQDSSGLSPDYVFWGETVLRMFSSSIRRAMTPEQKGFFSCDSPLNLHAIMGGAYLPAFCATLDCSIFFFDLRSC